MAKAKASSSNPKAHNKEDDEETKGLLSSHNGGQRKGRRDLTLDVDQDIETGQPRWSKYSDGDRDDGEWSRKKIVYVASFFIALLIFGAFARVFLMSPTPSTPSAGKNVHPNSAFHGDATRSNGTHEFKRTVLVVSIDGLRADYLDRGLTPHLLAISKKGLRAKSMRPIFPTLTFPNHWALMTGLFAESHGIIANNFYDPVSRSTFHYNQDTSAHQAHWWLGSPMWEVAEKAGVRTANLMWPGPPKTMAGTQPTYFIPWRDKVSLRSKLGTLLGWIDMPIEKRPELLFMYEPSLDQAGHSTGPYSARVNETLQKVDEFARDLHDSLEARNLTDIVDIIFVSDHGMTDTSNPELIYLDDILGTGAEQTEATSMEGMGGIEHVDGWPAMGLRFRSGANITSLLEKLHTAADRPNAHFGVYSLEAADLPDRWHLTSSHNTHQRIAPIWLVPDIGYVLTTHKEVEEGGGRLPIGLTKGGHGYDNSAKEMHAIFVAHGPFATNTKDVHAYQSGGKWHSTPQSPDFDDDKETYILDTFNNVELFSLVMQLVGVPGQMWKGKTNGTAGFWEEYLGNA